MSPLNIDSNIEENPYKVIVYRVTLVRIDADTSIGKNSGSQI